MLDPDGAVTMAQLDQLVTDGQYEEEAG